MRALGGFVVLLGGNEESGFVIPCRKIVRSFRSFLIGMPICMFTFLASSAYIPLLLAMTSKLERK
jgi:hypothetical protein